MFKKILLVVLICSILLALNAVIFFDIASPKDNDDTAVSSRNNQYAYSHTGSGDGKLWTLQIPDKVKITYETDQATAIDEFTHSVDDIIHAESIFKRQGGNNSVCILALLSPASFITFPIAMIDSTVDTIESLVLLINKGEVEESASQCFDNIVTRSEP